MRLGFVLYSQGWLMMTGDMKVNLFKVVAIAAFAQK